MNITINPHYHKVNQATSHGSHTSLTDEEVLQAIRDNLDKKHTNNGAAPKGCFYVPVDASTWLCPEVQLKDGDLVVGFWGKRDIGKPDSPCFHVYALVPTKEKQPANECHLVVYEDDKNEGDLILVTALATLGKGIPPMPITTVCRNTFGLPGGSEMPGTDGEKLQGIGDSYTFYEVGGIAFPASDELIERLKKAVIEIDAKAAAA